MYFHLFLPCLLIAGAGGETGAAAGSGSSACYDPHGLCDELPCSCEGACYSDSDCPGGFVCDWDTLWGPSSCFCAMFEGRPTWGESFDMVPRCAPAPVSTGPRGYTIQDLGTLGGPSSVGHSINNHVQIVGFSHPPQGGQHIFLWENGVMSNLTPTDQFNVFYTGARINNAGQVVIRDNAGPSTGIRWIHLWENGSSRIIGSIGSQEVLRINDHGQVLMGNRLWTNGSIVDVSSLSHPPLTTAYDVNNFGDFGGFIDVPGGTHAALVVDGQLLDLGTLGGDNGYVAKLNDLGQAVGQSQREGDTPDYNNAFLWSDGEMIDLGIAEITGRRRTTAHVINNCGEILASGGIVHPEFGYRSLSSLIDPALRWYMMWHGDDLNDRGQITGAGTVYVPGLGFPTRAYLMSPVPGDLNLDGAIDLDDYVHFFERFGTETTEYSVYCNRADFNHDGLTDLADFAEFQRLFTGSQ